MISDISENIKSAINIMVGAIWYYFDIILISFWYYGEWYMILWWVIWWVLSIFLTSTYIFVITWFSNTYKGIKISIFIIYNLLKINVSQVEESGRFWKKMAEKYAIYYPYKWWMFYKKYRIISPFGVWKWLFSRS